MSLRTPLGQVRGLGAAGDGARHWWAQRLTSLALVPLSLWFVVALFVNAGSDHAAAVAWLRSPSTSIALLLFIAVGFYHAHLGVQVIIEDYVHLESAKIGALIVSRFVFALLAVMGGYSVLHTAFGS